MTDINAKSVVSWLRHQAKLFNEAADAIEGVGLNGLVRGVTIEKIRDRLKQKKKRPQDLAVEFGVSVYEIQKLVNEFGSGIEMLDRGWLTVKIEGVTESETQQTTGEPKADLNE